MKFFIIAAILSRTTEWARVPVVSVLLVCAFTGAVPGGTEAQDDSVLNSLESIAGAFVKEIEAVPPYRKAYEIWLNQPVDHNAPAGGTFQQRFFLSHRDRARPSVIYTDGYEVTWPKKRELAALLGANKLEVEHRYFGVSTPHPPDPAYLTVEQAAADHHRIISLLKTIYTGKWIAAGKSRGGQCAFFHRSIYPRDVDATVAYVAPIMFSREDPRFLPVLESQLGRDTLDRLEKIQVALLQNRQEVLAAVLPESTASRLYIDAGKLFEYTVSALPFLFDHGKPDSPEIPQTGAGLEELCAFYAYHVRFSYYSESSRHTQQALHYQTATQIGYFGYPRDHLAPYLSGDHTVDCSLLTYPGPVPDFEATCMKGVQKRLNRVGNNIIYIYGEKDLWTACSVELSNTVNALKIIHPGGDHDVKIRDLSAADRDLVLSTLGEWLGIEIDSR